MAFPRIGILLPTRALLLQPVSPRDLEPILTMAESVDEAGYDSVWVGDSLLASPRPEAIVTLAAIAARTRNVRVGSAILIASLRHPVHLAHQLATLDLVSSGRLVVGIGYSGGTGLWNQEHEIVGVDAATRHVRVLEQITVLRKLWATSEASHDGDFFHLDGVDLTPKPVQQGGPPIWLHGMRGKKTLQRVAEHADGWMNNLPGAREFSEGWSRIREHAAALGRNSRDLAACHYSTIRLDDNGARARRTGREFMRSYYGGMDPDDIERLECCRFGTPEAVADGLSEFVEAGATTLVLRLAGEDQNAQIALCSEKLLPMLARTQASH